MIADREHAPYGSEMLRRVRQVDPDCDEKSVERYFGEIVEAEQKLSEIDVDISAPVLAFSPHWTPESKR